MILATLCLALTAAQQPGTDPSDPTVDATLIIFNDEVLTATELSGYMDRLAAARPELVDEQVFTGAVVNAMRDFLSHQGFLRLGLDPGLLEPEVETRINGLVNESGSRDRFLRTLEKDGYHSIEAFRQDLLRNMINQAFHSVVTGQSPMPQGGRRADATPTPEEIRNAYEDNESYRHQEDTLQWVILQFQKRTGLAPPMERAQALLSQLEAGEISPLEAARQADKALPRSGIADGIRADWADFLDFGVSGQAGELSETASGIVQFPLIVEQQEAREIPFPEAQAIIARDLRLQKEDEALRQAEADIWSSSYIWLAPNLEPLKDMLDEHYGVNMGAAGKSAEL